MIDGARDHTVEGLRRPPAEQTPARHAAGNIRVEIQALRAIAIALVVVYHLWPKRLPGGFVGVDVFFVVSGYLITAHLINEVARSGTISLSRFWARRIRRLLPAVFTVLLFCFAITTLTMRSQSEQNLQEIIAAAFYVENWALAFNAIDYLAAENAPSLVQHFWSLSAEEQFYIFWPLLIVLAVLVAKKAGRAPLPSMLIALSAVFIASFVHSIIMTIDRPAQAYFFTTTRAWEFAAGGLLALVPERHLRFLAHRPGAAFWGWVGVLGISAAALGYSDHTPFPSYFAALPVAATLLVLIFGTTESRGSVAHASGQRWILGLGDISYGLYLWHWPLIILATILLGGALPFWAKILVAVTACIAAYAMKRLLEDPARFRWKALQSPRNALLFMVSGVAVVSVLCVGTILVHRANQDSQFASRPDTGPCVGAPALTGSVECDDVFSADPPPDTTLAAKDVYWREGSVQADGVCAPHGASPTNCVLGTPSSPDRTVVFIGSSHGQHLLDPMDTVAKNLDWKLLPHVRARCSGFDSPEQIERRVSENPSVAEDVRECQRWGDAVFQRTLNDAEVSLVIISGRSVGATDFTRSRVRALEDSGKQVIWLGDTPDMPGTETAPACIERSGQRTGTCSYPEPVDPARKVAADLEVTYIDLHPNFCERSECHVLVGGIITFFDNNHLTLTYARSLAPYLERKLVEAVR